MKRDAGRRVVGDVHLDFLFSKVFVPRFQNVRTFGDILNPEFAIHLADGMEGTGVAAWILDLPGVSEVHDREAAAEQLELPADRIGDLAVLSDRHVALGRTPADHDLQLLAGGLRSHGGRYEQMVPILFSHPLNEQYLARAKDDPRNFDIFDFACNGVVL